MITKIAIGSTIIAASALTAMSGGLMIGTGLSENRKVFKVINVATGVCNSLVAGVGAAFGIAVLQNNITLTKN